MSGNVGKMVAQVADQFAALDKIVNTTQSSVDGLAAAMRGLTVEGRAAAVEWRQAAAAMRDAARAASGARVGTPARPRSAFGLGAVAGAAAGGGAGAGVATNYLRLTYQPGAPRGRLPGPSGPTIPLSYYGPNGGAVVPYGRGSNLPVPYWNGNRGFTTEGAPYTPYGGYSTGRPWRPYAALPPPPNTGFTMGDDTTFAGGGGGGGGGPIVPAGPVGPGGGVPYPISRPMRMPVPPQHLDGWTAALEALDGAETVKHLLDAAAQVDAGLAKLKNQGFTAAQIAQARKAIYATQRGIGGTSLTGNLEILRTLTATTQNASEALALLPAFAKAGVVYGNLTGQDGPAAAEAAIRVAEFRGILTKKNAHGQTVVNVAGVEKLMGELEAAASITGGQIGPTQMLQMLRASGAAGAMISDPTAFAEFLSLQQAMGTSRAGRALRGFEQQFMSGKMSQASAKLLATVGVIRGGTDIKRNPYLLKAGFGNYDIEPGAMPAGEYDLAIQNPIAFTTSYLVPKVQEYLSKKYGKRYTGAGHVRQEEMTIAMLTQIASRLPGGDMMVEAFRNIQLIQDRDVPAYRKQLAKGPNAAYTTLWGNDPVLHLRAFDNAFDALMASLGQPAVKEAAGILDDLTGDMNAVAKFAQQHGQLVQLGMEALAGAVIALGSGAALKALGALGGPAGQLALLGAGIGILSEKMNAVPKWLINAGTAALIGGRVAGAPGAVAGAVGGAAWDANPFGLNKITPQQALDRLERYLFGGGHQHAAPPGPGAPSLWFPTGSLLAHAPHSHAPIGTSGGGPVHVTGHVTAQITNPGDLTTGVARGMARSMNRPLAGYTGVDPTQDPQSAYIGMTPP